MFSQKPAILTVEPMLLFSCPSTEHSSVLFSVNIKHKSKKHNCETYAEMQLSCIIIINTSTYINN